MVQETQPYFPPSESKGGWRSLTGVDEVRNIAGMDMETLSKAHTWNEQYPVASAVVVIRRGYLVAEWYANGARANTLFNIYSCTKSFTGTAYGLLFEDIRQGRLLASPNVDLDTPAYLHIPAGYPLTDPRKERITLRHLLSMSSGIPGESIGIFGASAAPGINAFEAALGRFPLKSSQVSGPLWTATLAAEPGSRWDYSDPAFAHLGLAFNHITGQEISQFLRARVFGPISIENASWEILGLDDGRIGPHVMPMGGLHLTARDMARFGYLMLRGGAWQGERLIAPWWVELATRNSQPMNPHYGLTWWLNSAGLWPEARRDAFAAMGFNTNLCCVIPSLDMVVVRLGLGPTDHCEIVTAPFLGAVSQSVLSA
jgi:CubicO group peptidase (beta-lactamase class C family)